MESYAEAVGMMERFDVGSQKTDSSSHLSSVDVSIIPLLDRLLFFFKGIVEYSFGVYIGAVVGWLLGRCMGKSYVEHFAPVYSSDLNDIKQWLLVPYDFARGGAIIGIAAGAIAIAFVNSKLLHQRIIFLHEKRITDPKDIAPLLGKSVRQIKRKINKLAKKGK